MAKIILPITLAFLLVAATVMTSIPINWSYSQSPETETFVIPILKDSFLRTGDSNTNEGANPLLTVRASGATRALAAFSQDDISSQVQGKTVVSAKMSLFIADNGNNWGPYGRTIDVHRLGADWAEGNGWNVGGSIRGSGSGATWNCAADSDISNPAPDCAAQWNGGSFSAASGSVLVMNAMENQWIEFDVTDDVKSFLNGTNANYGWLVKKTQESLSGLVEFASKEAGSNQPVLEITVVDGGAEALRDEYLELVGDLGQVGNALNQTDITQELIDDIDANLTRLKEVVIELQNLGLDGLVNVTRIGEKAVGTVEFYDSVTNQTFFQITIPDGAIAVLLAMATQQDLADQGESMPIEGLSLVLNHSLPFVGNVTLIQDDIAMDLILSAMAPYHPSTGHSVWFIRPGTGWSLKPTGWWKNCEAFLACQSAVDLDDDGTLTKVVDLIAPPFLLFIKKYEDVNGDGNFESEPGLGGWTFKAISSQSFRVNPGITGDDGWATISGRFDRVVNQFIVIEELQDGWIVTDGELITFENVVWGDVLWVPFTPSNITLFEPFLVGNFKLGQISGLKFEDLNGDGNRTSGEPGLGNWTIVLKNATSGSILDTALTDSTGFYDFTGLEFGSYTVEEVQQEGYTQTEPASGSYVIDIQSGTFSSGNDFGNRIDSANFTATIQNTGWGGAYRCQYLSSAEAWCAAGSTKVWNPTTRTTTATLWGGHSIGCSGAYCYTVTQMQGLNIVNLTKWDISTKTIINSTQFTAASGYTLGLDIAVSGNNVMLHTMHYGCGGVSDTLHGVCVWNGAAWNATRFISYATGASAYLYSLSSGGPTASDRVIVGTQDVLGRRSYNVLNLADGDAGFSSNRVCETGFINDGPDRRLELVNGKWYIPVQSSSTWFEIPANTTSCIAIARFTDTSYPVGGSITFDSAANQMHVVSFRDNGGNVEAAVKIHDATSYGHLYTVDISGGTSDFIYDSFWHASENEVHVQQGSRMVILGYG